MPSNSTALILIDIQQGLDELDYYGGERNNPQAEEKAAMVLLYWRQQQWPIFHIKHNSSNSESPLHPSRSGNAIKDIVQPLPHEPLIEKEVNNAFTSTDLQQRLEANGITELVIVGLTTEHCVSSTVRVGANLGFSVTLVSDATAAFCKTASNGKHYDAETVHEIAIANLADEFARIQTAEEVLLALQSNRSEDR